MLSDEDVSYTLVVTTTPAGAVADVAVRNAYWARTVTFSHADTGGTCCPVMNARLAQLWRSVTRRVVMLWASPAVLHDMGYWQQLAQADAPRFISKTYLPGVDGGVGSDMVTFEGSLDWMRVGLSGPAQLFADEQPIHVAQTLEMRPYNAPNARATATIQAAVSCVHALVPPGTRALAVTRRFRFFCVSGWLVTGWPGSCPVPLPCRLTSKRPTQRAPRIVRQR